MKTAWICALALLFISAAHGEKVTETYFVHRPDTAHRMVKSYYAKAAPQCDVTNPDLRHLCAWYRSLQMDKKTGRLLYLERLLLKSTTAKDLPDWSQGVCYFRDAITGAKFQRPPVAPDPSVSYPDYDDICETWVPYFYGEPPWSEPVMPGPGYGNGIFDLGDKVTTAAGQKAKIVAVSGRDGDSLEVTFPRTPSNRDFFALEIDGKLWSEAISETEILDGEIDEDFGWRETHTCLRPQAGDRFADEDKVVEQWESNSISCPTGSTRVAPDRISLEVHQGNGVINKERFYFTIYRTGEKPVLVDSYNSGREIPYFGRGACELWGSSGGGIGGGGSSDRIAQFGARQSDLAVMDFDLYSQAIDFCGAPEGQPQRVVFQRTK